MSDTKFTKGKWKIQDDGYNLIGVRIEKGFGILVGGKSKTNIANANLIAAAPEMYTMLEFLVMNDSINDHTIDKEVEQLLSRARGEA